MVRREGHLKRWKSGHIALLTFLLPPHWFRWVAQLGEGGRVWTQPLGIQIPIPGLYGFNSGLCGRCRRTPAILLEQIRPALLGSLRFILLPHTKLLPPPNLVRMQRRPAGLPKLGLSSEMDHALQELSDAQKAPLLLAGFGVSLPASGLPKRLERKA